MKIKKDFFLSEILRLRCGTVIQREKPWDFGAYDFLTFKTAHFDELREALKQGFRYITTNVILKRFGPAPQSEKLNGRHVVGALKTADIPGVLELSKNSFTLDRFHLDSRLGKREADVIYERWAENDCRGRAGGVLVARAGGKVVGFLTVVGQGIDLLAVHPEFSNQGVGTTLLQAALKRYPIKETITQINNSVLGFYQKVGGFVPSGLVYVLHWWRAAL